MTGQPAVDLAAEEAVLGGMLLSASAITEVAGIIEPCDFYKPAHELIYRAIIDLHAAGTPVDAVTAAAELSQRGELVRVDGAPYLHTLVSSVPVAANAGHYADIVRDRSTRRRGVEFATRFVYAMDVDQTTPEDLPDVVARFQDDLLALSDLPTVGNSRAGTIVTLASVTPERVRWLWPGRLPLGKLVLLDGDPSVGKSTLALDWAARVSTGAKWPDGADAPGAADVLLLSAEDGLADTLAPRLAAAGADRGRVHVLTEVPIVDSDGRRQFVPPSLPRDIPVIERAIAEHGVRLVIVDVLMAYLSGGVDAHRDQDVRAVLHRLAAMAERTGCTVLLIRHLNKAGGSNPLYRGGGSIGIVGAARAAFLVARDPDNPERRILAVSKLNIAVEPPSLAYTLVSDTEYGVARVVWEDEPNDYRAADLLGTPTDADERDDRSEAEKWLRDYLESQPGWEADAAVILREAKRVGFHERAIQRARKKIPGASSKRVGFGRESRWVWRLDPVEDGDAPGTPSP